MENKERIFDITERVKVVTTDKSPFHKAGETRSVSPAVAKKFIEKGYAKKG